MRTPMIATVLCRLPWTLPDNAMSSLRPTGTRSVSCDGTLDITDHDNTLVRSCRMKGRNTFGGRVPAVPATKEA